MTASAERRFAWEGVAFDAPSDWELAAHEKRQHVVRLRLEDDDAVRFIGEWTRPAASGPDLSEIVRRFEASARTLRKTARRSESLTDLPPGWSSAVYEMSEGPTMGVAFYLTPRRELFGVFELHQRHGSLGEMKSRVRRFIASFSYTPLDQPRLWSCYDVTFVSPPFFELEEASFHAGLRQMTFGRARRRLCLTFASLADIVLKRFQTPLGWALAALAADRRLPGPIFEADQGRIRVRRRPFFGRYHYSEVWRGCFRYDIRYHHDPDRNQLALLCFHYRRESDRQWLAPLEDLFPPNPHPLRVQ